MQQNVNGEPFKPYSDALISRLRETSISRREAVRARSSAQAACSWDII